MTVWGFSGKSTGFPIMYKKSGRSPAALEESEGWQDWPPADSTEQLQSTAEERPNLSANPAPVPAKRQNGLAWPVLDAADQAKSRRPTAKVFALALGVLLLLGAGSWYGHYWWTVGRFLVSTDDAYVGAKNATLSAKIMGYVSEVLVADNAHVHEGDIIARIDDGDYQLAVQTALDNIATQQATVERIGKQITAQEAAVDQAKAQLTSSQAAATRADLELKRQQDLAARNIASRQTLEQAQATRDQANASVQSAQAAVEAAQATVDVLKAQQVEASRSLNQLQTAKAKAERDLSFTVIRAPFDGVVGNRAMQVGDLVQPGQRLASLVPLDAIYIDANFKETQLANLHPGQPVDIAVDAFSDRKLKGRVVSVAPASGSVFSLLPPDNATGNFTKIVQRLPVRIAVPAAVAEQGMLRPGMSVVVSVDTKPDAVAAVDKGAAVTAYNDIPLRRVK
jgi:membrane fusion protein, multidrug efflux system